MFFLMKHENKTSKWVLRAHKSTCIHVHIFKLLTAVKKAFSLKRTYYIKLRKSFFLDETIILRKTLPGINSCDIKKKKKNENKIRNIFQVKRFLLFLLFFFLNKTFNNLHLNCTQQVKDNRCVSLREKTTKNV